jgi:hypothetical protein
LATSLAKARDGGKRWLECRLTPLVYKIQDALNNRRKRVSDMDQQPRLKIEPLGVSLGLRQQACEAIKRAIMAMDIYGHAEEIRLDERQLSQDLGVSRTPIREALSVLEQEGFEAGSGGDDNRLGGHRKHGRAAGGGTCHRERIG